MLDSLFHEESCQRCFAPAANGWCDSDFQATHAARDMLKFFPLRRCPRGTEVELLTSQFSPVIRACRFPGKNKFLGARSLMLLKDQGDPGKVLRRVEV